MNTRNTLMVMVTIFGMALSGCAKPQSPAQNNGSATAATATPHLSNLQVTSSGGSGTTSGSSTASVVSIGSGNEHSCALLSDGTIQCWGANEYGQLGNVGAPAMTSTPVQVSGIQSATALAVGGEHTCAILADKTVSCWGMNANGQVGSASGNSYEATPVQVQGVANATAIAAGALHTCAILADTTMMCWGADFNGQLGNGEYARIRNAPVAVQNLSGAIAVTVGDAHTCAIVAGGQAYCWGQNDVGQLGNASMSDQFASDVPVPVDGASNVVSLSAGSAHTCAILSDSTVSCWGDDSDGELGDDGLAQTAYSPLAIAGVSSAVAISVGGYHTCVAFADGSVGCWGSNDSGESGSTNLGVTQSAPGTVSGLSQVTLVASGSSHTCALTSSGAVQCWGSDGVGESSDASYAAAITTPVTVSGL